MPVYIRKGGLSFTPDSLLNVQEEDDNDYLQDPDQLYDVLPQPYRMINKVLEKILSDTWDIIEAKENRRLEEERKIKPPKYEGVRIQGHSHATALAETDDGKCVVVGLPNGLAIMDAQTQETKSSWEEDGAEITNVTTCTVNATHGYYLITTIDDMAVARLFLFACDHIYLVKTMNETHESGTKMLAHKFETSFEGDYIGIVLENTTSKEVWLEVHKVPKDAWLKDLEGIEATLQKQKEQQKAEEEKQNEMAPSGDQEFQPSEESLKSQELSHHGHKFAVPTPILKVRPPSSYQANQASSVSSACQKVDRGDVLGVGHTHIMSAAQLEARDSAFGHMHTGLMQYLNKEERRSLQDDFVTATFHFINAGRTLPAGYESLESEEDKAEKETDPKKKPPPTKGKTEESAEETVPPVDKSPILRCEHPTGVALWWKGSCHLLQFSLIKTAKDIEHKPDAVWPFSCNISASAISRCTSHIAIGLENGNVVVWDRYMAWATGGSGSCRVKIPTGLQRGVVNMNKASSVQLLRFLNPSLYPPAPMDYPPYPQRSGTFLLAQYRDSSQFVYDVGRNIQDQPVRISDEPETDDEVQTVLASVPDLPELTLVVQKNGNLYLKDVQTGALICQLVLPPTHRLSSPWEPTLSFGARGQLLYVKGDGVQIDEEDDEFPTTYRSSMYVFTLRSYPTLDKYWNQTRTDNKLMIHPTIDQRLDALMKERIAQQALRKSRMQMRWGMLRADLSVIQNAREVQVSQSFQRQFVTPTSGRSSVDHPFGKFMPSTECL